MIQGRCTCGHSGPLPKVQAHQVECSDYAAAYREGRENLDPALAYEQWAAGGRKAARDAAHAESVADTDRRREFMAKRFASKDILED